jgi:hypothetical protein
MVAKRCCRPRPAAARAAEGAALPASGRHPDRGEISVAPRVSFLVRDRQGGTRHISCTGALELGEWFDGPRFPVAPISAVFNYEPGRYPKCRADRCAVWVNLPCHSRITKADLSRPMREPPAEFVEQRGGSDR